MLTLENNKLSNISIPVSTAWLLGSCMEARGKQDLWIAQQPEVIEVLKEQAIIQSVESSNRIEGVIIKQERLRPIIIGKVKPRNRSEEELSGYKKALDWIYSRKREVILTPDVIKKLHELAQGGFSGDAGKWKQKSNEIIEIMPNGEKRIRFVPTSASETPNAVYNLCKNYQDACHKEQVPELLIIASFIFDLLCIDPFRHGNGRVSRLVTTLMLKSKNYDVVKYISLERLIEDNKVEYYETLERCSQGWHDGKNEIIPWWNFFLSNLRQAYKEFQQKVESTQSRIAKTEIVKQVILSQVEQFTLADLSKQLPSTSNQLIKKVLYELKKQEKVRLTGKGRGAIWQIIL